jgi:hypothetical protein
MTSPPVSNDERLARIARIATSTLLSKKKRSMIGHLQILLWSEVVKDDLWIGLVLYLRL